jgi:hypothetical protein
MRSSQELIQVVEWYSSVIDDPYEDKLDLHKDHMSVCKFATKMDTDYEYVIEVLQRWTDHLPAPAASTEPDTTQASGD